MSASVAAATWRRALARVPRVEPALGWHFAGDAAWKASALVALACVTRTAPEEHVLAYVLLQAPLSLLIAGGDLGFCATGTRLVARNQNPTNVERVRAVVQARRLRAVAVLGLPIAAMAGLRLIDDIHTGAVLAVLLASWLPWFLSVDWLLVALGRLRELALSRIAASAVVLLAACVSAVAGWGAWGVGLGYALALSLQGAISRRAARVAPAGAEPASPVIAAPLDELGWRASTTLAVAFAISAFFQSLDVLLTGWAFGTEAAALYAAALRPAAIVYGLVWVGIQALAPHLARQAGGDAPHQALMRLVREIVPAGALLGLLLFAFAPLVVQLLYGDRFQSAGAVLRLLCGTLVLESVAALLGTALVMRGAAAAALATLSVGVAAAAAGCGAAWLSDSQVLAPVAARYAGYTGLIAAQCWALAKPRAGVH